MGFSTRPTKGPIAEINVTPFVDVVLVLLIIFMVTAPLMYNGIALQLPRTKKVKSVNLTSGQVILSVSKAGDLFIEGERILPGEVIAILTKLLTEKKSSTLYLRADFEIKYGKVAKLMSLLKRGGISNIALVTEIEK